MCVKGKQNVDMTHKRINYVRMHERAQLPHEIVGFKGRKRTGCFTSDNEKSPFECWFVEK